MQANCSRASLLAFIKGSEVLIEMILTKEFLKQQSVERSIFSSTESRILHENAVLNSKKNNVYDVFISHSFLDKPLVITLVNLFNQAGYSVYVDWIEDSTLDRTHVTETTVELIRERITQSKSLAYIATSNISSSKWCPWELGVADGIHDGRAAILPILSQNQSFNGQEYLNVYPYIDYEKKSSGEMDFWVSDQKNPQNYVVLSDWLKGNQPFLHN